MRRKETNTKYNYYVNKIITLDILVAISQSIRKPRFKNRTFGAVMLRIELMKLFVVDFHTGKN